MIRKTKRPKILTHEKRMEWLIKLLENSDFIGLNKTPKGYVVQTNRNSTRTCDNILEAIDAAISDESFF